MLSNWFNCKDVDQCPEKKGRSPFLTIQLLSQFDFGHRTPKPVIFAIELSKPFKFDRRGCFDGWF